MVWVWAAIFLVTILIEVFSMELDCVWFSIGSLIAFILALCHVSITAQIIVFLVVSIALLLSVGIICKKLLKNTKSKTNLDMVIGTTHTLIKGIEPEVAGEVKVNDVVWRAVSKDGESIAKNEKVKIVSVEGNKFIVEKESK